MSLVFADAYFFFGMLNPRDAAHQRCVDYSVGHESQLITTAWVFTELADGLGRSTNRHLVAGFIDAFKSKGHTLVPAAQDLFDRGLLLFDQRPDKHWSLTDCISFVVMQEHGVTDALTADQHFEQAGFVPLLAG